MAGDHSESAYNVSVDDYQVGHGQDSTYMGQGIDIGEHGRVHE